MADQQAEFDRISFTAVLAADGADVGHVLIQAGIVQPVSVPVVCDNGGDAPAGVLGDGITPNLTAVLDAGPAAAGAPDPVGGQNTRGGNKPSSPAAATVSLPAAFGSQPLAPVRARRG